MSDFLSDMDKCWSIGNGVNPETNEFEGEYFEAYSNGMNMNQHTLEIMNSTVTVYGDTINSGEVIKAFIFISELVIETNTLSVPEPPQPIEMIMYPNPARESTNFKGEYIENMTVYDVNGRVIKRVDVNDNNYKLQLDGMDDGIYMIQIWLADRRGIFKKLIIKRM